MNELLWYVSRVTGIASIVLLTAVLVLGLVTSSSRRAGDGPRRDRGRGTSGPERAAVVLGLHRSLALGSVAFLLAHIATAIGETYVSIDLVSAVVPFTSGYETAWVGLGTVAVDVLAAVVVTSLLRHRMPVRLWKAVHLLAFAFWPIAIVHGIALGTSDELLLRGTTAACAVVGAGALLWRATTLRPSRPTDPQPVTRGTGRDTDRDRRRAVLTQEWS